MANKTFSARDRRRFAQIKEELHLLMPDTRPRSEAVHRCALLFAEVRDQGYQQIDGHELVEKWMWRIFKVGDRQARKWFDAATLPAAEVRGKRQGIEVMGGQIALETDAAVRAALWALAEDEGCSATALGAGRVKLRPHLARGDLAVGIEALRQAARKKAQEEEAERERKRAVPRGAGVRAQEVLGQAK